MGDSQQVMRGTGRGTQYIYGGGLGLQKISMDISTKSVSVTVKNTKSIKVPTLKFVSTFT